MEVGSDTVATLFDTFNAPVATRESPAVAIPGADELAPESPAVSFGPSHADGPPETEAQGRVHTSAATVAVLPAKMQEYVDNGARLGWLIDPLEKKVYVYRPGEEPVCLDNAESVSADPVLPGFKLDMRRLWSS